MGLSDARYIRYTADTRYVGKVGNRNIKENRLKVLKDTFAEEFSNSEMNLILPAKLETVIKSNYNLIYDFSHWNRIFFT